MADTPTKQPTLPSTFTLRLDSDSFLEIDELEFSSSCVEAEFSVEIEIGDHQDSITIQGEFDPDYTEIKDEVSGINLSVSTEAILDAVIHDLKEEASHLHNQKTSHRLTDEQFTAALLAFVADRCAKADLPRSESSGALLFGVSRDEDGNTVIQRVNTKV